MNIIEQESPLSYQISQISKDSDLLSLFSQFNDNQQMNQQKPNICQLSDIKPSQNFNNRGYFSDDDNKSRKKKNIKKPKQVINLKQKQRTKKRTKLYMQMLQNRINQLQNQNQKLKKLNKINKEYIHRLNQQQHNINGYFVGKQQVYQKLQSLNSQSQPNNNKITQEIISLRLRQGSFGKDRLKSINYYFKEMVEMLLPEIQKYLIKTVIQQSDFFQSSYIDTGKHRRQIESWRRKLLENIEEENEQFSKLREYLKSQRLNLLEQSDKFKKMLQDLYNMKCNLILQGKKIQQIFNGAHKFLNPVQISKTLCYIDRYRFEKNITLENTFNQIFQKAQNQNFSYNIEEPFKTK